MRATPIFTGWTAGFSMHAVPPIDSTVLIGRGPQSSANPPRICEALAIRISKRRDRIPLPRSGCVAAVLTGDQRHRSGRRHADAWKLPYAPVVVHPASSAPISGIRPHRVCRHECSQAWAAASFTRKYLRERIEIIGVELRSKARPDVTIGDCICVPYLRSTYSEMCLLSVNVTQ